MKAIKFETANIEYRAPDSMRDTCQTLYVQKGEGKIVSCWELDDDELAEVNQTRRIYLTVEGDVQPPIYPSTYNYLTDILSFSASLKGDKTYLIVTKLWEGKTGTVDYFSFVEITPDMQADQPTKEHIYIEVYYQMCLDIEAKIGRQLLRKEIVLRLATGVRTLESEDIIPLLSTSYCKILNFGAMKKEETALQTSANEVVKVEPIYYIIAEAQGLRKAFAWKRVTENWIAKDAAEHNFEIMERALVANLERQKGRVLTFEPVQYYVAKQKDQTERRYSTIEELFEHCDIKPLGERIQF